MEMDKKKWTWNRSISFWDVIYQLGEKLRKREKMFLPLWIRTRYNSHIPFFSIPFFTEVKKKLLEGGKWKTEIWHFYRDLRINDDQMDRTNSKLRSSIWKITNDNQTHQTQNEFYT